VSHQKGAYLGGIRCVMDLRDRCYVDKDTGCWHWRLATCQNLPKVHLHGRKHAVRGRRAAMILSLGRDLVQGEMAVAKCDSLDCVNPGHAFIGTRKDHAEWMRKTGRSKSVKKQISILKARMARKKTKLSFEIAREMRASDEPTHVLAERYGVAKSAASAARSGRSWREFDLIGV
jgi:hypothetical protein